MLICYFLFIWLFIAIIYKIILENSFIIMKFNKIVSSILFISLLLSLIVPFDALAFDKNYKQELIVDLFVEQIQIQLDRIRDIEDNYAVITDDDLDYIEDLFSDILYSIKLELLRLQDIDFLQRERLEIESVLQEIYFQIDIIVDNIEDKIDSNSVKDEDFESFKDDIISESLSFQKKLDELLESKLSVLNLSRTEITGNTGTNVDDLDLVINSIESLKRRFENLEEEAKTITATENNATSMGNEAFEKIEEAENEIRTLSYVHSYNSSELRQAIRNLIKKVDDFKDTFEETFNTSFSSITRDYIKLLEYGEDQIQSAYSDVLSGDNLTNMTYYDVETKLNRLISDAIEYHNNIPGDKITEIHEAILDYFDDDRDDDDDDLLESMEELRDDAIETTTIEKDLSSDTEQYINYLLDGFKIIRDENYTYPTEADITSKLDGYIGDINSIKTDLEASISQEDELDEIEEDLNKVLHYANNAILELTLVNPVNENDLRIKIAEIAIATSETIDEIDSRTSSFDDIINELKFDYIGGIENTSGIVTDSRFSIETQMYNSASSVSGANSSTTPSAFLSFIESKSLSLNSLESAWGSDLSSDTLYREAEKSLYDTVVDIQKEIYKLAKYNFNRNINSEVIANNIGHYYQNLLNKAEDYVDLIDDSISSDENDDLEEQIEDLYEECLNGFYLLEDSSTSIGTELADILSDIEEEKERLNRTLLSITVSSSSSSNHSKFLSEQFSEDLDTYKSAILNIQGEVPADLDSNNDFREIENDLNDEIDDIIQTAKNISNNDFELEYKKNIQISFNELRIEIEELLNKLLKNRNSGLKRDVRDLNKETRKNITTIQILIDDSDITEEEEEDFSLSKNLRNIEKKVEKIQFSVDSISEIEEYHEELDEFREEFRELFSFINRLNAVAPSDIEELDLDNLDNYQKSFDDNWDDTIDRFGETNIMDQDNLDYLDDSFTRYINRYKIELDANFQGALNGFSVPSVVFKEIYEEGTGEVEPSIIDEDGEEETLEGVDTDFLDVKKDNVFSPYIKVLADQNMVKGYEDGKFYPDKTVSRAEFIKIAIAAKKVSQSKLKTEHLTFLDVDKENALAPYIGAGVSLGYINGYSDKNFGPNDPITRIDAIRIMIRIKTLFSTTFPSESEYFSDILTADLAMLTDTAYDAGLISGFSDQTFRPYNNISRGETSKIIANAFLYEV